MFNLPKKENQKKQTAVKMAWKATEPALELSGVHPLHK